MHLSNYNVEDYTDNQLYDILQLVNPSDRELEAKILYYIKKYEDILERSPENEEAKKLFIFFEDMYDLFFGSTSDEEINESQNDYIISPPTPSQREGFSNGGGGADGESGGDGATDGGAGATATGNELDVNAAPNYAPSNNIPIFNQVNYTEDPDKLNPILKQTVTTLLTIDSSYREEKYAQATNFSFNLSRPLRDVISLKLYSVQIPYTWWTINNYYGGNFFYLKGNVPGIDNGNHDYQVLINSGNYTAETMTNAINSYITNKMPTIYTDVSFQGTYLEYFTSSSISRLHINLKKQFVETDYIIEFPPSVSTLEYFSLYNFFGYSNTKYDFNTFYSKTKPVISNSFNQSLYNVNDTNNYFYVIHYQQANSTSNPYGLYDETTSTVLNKYSVSIPTNSVYTETALLNAVNTAVSSYPNFVNSSLTREYDSSGNYYYKFYIQLNRFNNYNYSGAKIAVVFPQENSIYPIWSEVGNPSSQNCAFDFDKLTNELSNMVSEDLAKQTNYTVLNDLSFSLICTLPYYIDPLNDYYFDVSSSIKEIGSIYNGEYIISEYVDHINMALNDTNITTYSEANPNGVLNISNTYAYLENSTQFMKMKFDINKTFTQKMFTVDLSSSFFYYSFGFPQIVSDISGEITGNFLKMSTYIIEKGTGTIYFYANDGYGLSTRPPFIIHFPENVIYNTLNDFTNAIQSTFSNFTDEYGDKIFSRTTITYKYDIYNNATFILNIKLNKVLTENNYKVVFYGGSDNLGIIGNGDTNYWLKDMKFNSSYDLANYEINQGGGIYYSLISGTSKIDTVNFVIDASNDTFTFIPQTDGVATWHGENNIDFKIPHGLYSQTQIMNELNSLFDENILTKGSRVYLNTNGYTVFRMYINKLYTAKDWKLVFFDIYSFVQCSGSSTVNAVWDATLGWLLGFQSHMEYPLISNEIYSSTNYYYRDVDTEEIVVGGDSVLNTNRINYLMIILNDYNQNHLNNSLVTVIGGENTTTLPSYSTYYQQQCSNVNTANNIVNLGNSGGLNKDPNTFNSLTQKQVYAIQQTNDANYTINTNNLYTKGPNIKDIFSMIPIKTVGMVTGQVYTEYGGTLQNQVREYFGPVNIQRISISLVADNGQILDLNGCNWSFTVIVEQLYGTTTKRDGKKMA